MNEVAHRDPIWREDADVILRARLEGGEGLPDWEQLWGRLTSTRRAILCCIPFGGYDIHLGDEVEFDDDYILTRTVRRSQHFTFRLLWLTETPGATRQEVLDELASAGALVERFSDGLVGVSVEGRREAEHVSGVLMSLQQLGILIYETGASR